MIFVMAGLSERIRDTSLHRPVPLQARYQILRVSWNLRLDEDQFRVVASRYQAYFRNYEAYCDQCPFNGLGELTHADVLFTVTEMKMKTRAHCEESLTARLSDLIEAGHGSIVGDCIKFVGDSLIMLDLSSWTAFETIKEFVQGQLIQPSMQNNSLRLPRSFNAHTMARVAGFKIRWTSDLSKHLAMSDNDEDMSVFHHATYLDLVAESELYVTMFSPKLCYHYRE